MRCFRQPLAFLFLFIGFYGPAWSQQSFTSLPSAISDPSAALTPGATHQHHFNSGSERSARERVSWGAFE
jgi:hypothetical protein